MGSARPVGSDRRKNVLLGEKERRRRRFHRPAVRVRPDGGAGHEIAFCLSDSIASATLSWEVTNGWFDRSEILLYFSLPYSKTNVPYATSLKKSRVHFGFTPTRPLATAVEFELAPSAKLQITGRSSMKREPAGLVRRSKKRREEKECEREAGRAITRAARQEIEFWRGDINCSTCFFLFAGKGSKPPTQNEVLRVTRDIV